MWVKLYVVEVKEKVVWMDDLFAKALALLTRKCSMVKLVLLHRHSEEVQSTGYIQDLFSLYPCINFHFV